MTLHVEGLRKSFTLDRGAVRAVEDISFTVEEGRFFTLLGPSGCGKTTTLRWTVFENVAFPLRVSARPPSRAALRKAVEESLALVGLDGLEDRPAPQLSGGQQQRLALARALVRRPKLLLLDEPLSNLDAKLRERMRIELRQLQRRLGITTIYVTHDQGEALFLSHRIAVMQNGRIVQEGSPRDLYAHPASGFVADFVGEATFLAGTLSIGGLAALGGIVRCSVADGLGVGQQALLALRPENINVRSTASGAENEFVGTLRVAAFLGDRLDCVVEIGDLLVRARAHPSAQLVRDQTVWVEFPVEHCVAIPDDGWRPKALARTFDDE